MYLNYLIALVLVGFSFASLAIAGPEYCGDNRWIQSGEPKIVKQFSKNFQREKDLLRVTINNGKKVEFRNSDELKYYAKGEDPSQTHAIVMVTGNEYGAYELVNLKSGQRLKTDGCPFWSENGSYFVALNADLEMRSSENMAALYFSKDSYVKLTDLVQDKERSSSGGKGAIWKGNTVTVTLVKEVNGGEPGEVKEFEKTCTLKNDKATCR